MYCRELHALPEVALLAGLKELLQPLRMGLAKALGDDQLSHCAAERFIARPSEHIGGAVIPFGDLAVGAHDDHGVERGVQQQIERAFPLRARAHQSCASFYGKYSTKNIQPLGARRYQRGEVFGRRAIRMREYRE